MLSTRKRLFSNTLTERRQNLISVNLTWKKYDKIVTFCLLVLVETWEMIDRSSEYSNDSAITVLSEFSTFAAQSDSCLTKQQLQGLNLLQYICSTSLSKVIFFITKYLFKTGVFSIETWQLVFDVLHVL